MALKLRNSQIYTNFIVLEGGDGPSGDLLAAIEAKWGSVENFVKTFNAKTAAIQGSGWGWLGAQMQQMLERFLHQLLNLIRL